MCQRQTSDNKPAPNWATLSRSAAVLADAMASGSLSVKGNTSLRKREKFEKYR